MMTRRTMNLRHELHVDWVISTKTSMSLSGGLAASTGRKMKRGHSNKKYYQRSSDETIFSVIKRVMRENVRSVRVKTQNDEVRFRLKAYNANRIANLALSLIIGFLKGRG